MRFIFLLFIATMLAGVSKVAQAQDGARAEQYGYCLYNQSNKVWVTPDFASSLDHNQIHYEFLARFGRPGYGDRCQLFKTVQEMEISRNRVLKVPYDYIFRYGLLDWMPSDGRNPKEDVSAASDRRTVAVYFRDPQASAGEKGYTNSTFDVEYQFIACQGELHLAYSVVKGSVRSKAPTYLLNNVSYRVSTPSPTVISLPINGEVWMEPYVNSIIGKFSDNFASEALGFGCVSGQTKKIANLKDINNDLGKPATKEELIPLLNRLRVSFKTNTVLTNGSAEEEIRKGAAATTGATGDNGGRKTVPRETEAEQERMQQQTQEALKANEAYFAKVKAAADAEATRRKAEQEAYQREVRAAEAAKVAYQTELAKARAAEAEYQRKRQVYREQYKQATGQYAPD